MLNQKNLSLQYQRLQINIYIYILENLIFFDKISIFWWQLALPPAKIKNPKIYIEMYYF